MIYKEFSKLESKEKYKIVKGSVIPRPISWITTLSENGTVNLAPFSYFNMISSEHLMVSILRTDLGMKDTAKNIKVNKEAVVHITSLDQIAAIDNSSKNLDYGESEVENNRLTLVQSKLIKTPGISEPKIRFETTLTDYYPLKDEDDENIADVFILKIVAAYLSETVYDNIKGYVLSDALKPISRLGGPDYATIQLVENFKRKNE